MNKMATAREDKTLVLSKHRCVCVCVCSVFDV